MMNDYISMCMYIINKIPHEKCFVHYLIFMGLVFVSETHLFAVLTHSTCDLLTTRT